MKFFTRTLRFLTLGMPLLIMCAFGAEGFLPPEQAFVFKAQMVDAKSAQVTFFIAPNYYMYRDEFAFSVLSSGGAIVQNGAIKLPKAQIKFDENFNKDVAIYHNSVTVHVPVKKIADGDGLFKLVVTSRGCADKGLCYPPRKTQAVLSVEDKASPVVESAEQKIKEPSEANALEAKNAIESIKQIKNESNRPLEAPVVAAEVENNESAPANSFQKTIVDTPTAQEARANAATFDNSAFTRGLFERHNIWLTLVFVFGVGVLLSFTPCMLPMFPIVMTMLAGQEVFSRIRGFLLSLAYVTGMALVYAAIGLLAAKTGLGLQRYLQNPWALGVFSIVLLVLAFSMFDVFQLQIPERWQIWLAEKTQGKGGYIGALIFGVASALIVSPCVTAPLVGIIGYISQTGNTTLGGLALLVLAYGMGLPLLLLGAGLGHFLPKRGAWMTYVKHTVGVLMVIAALWIAQPLWGKYWQITKAEQEALPFLPINSSEQLNKTLAQSSRFVLLDLYADWCRSCIEMERDTFSDDRVRAMMKDMMLVRVDMTKYTDEHAALLQRFNLYGPPGIILFEPKTGREKSRVIGFESADVFIKHISP